MVKRKGLKEFEMDLWNRFRALLATVFAAHQLIFAAPQEPSTRWLTREEIEERETQAALRELEKLQNRRDFPR
jgi:hypothetical protein